MTGECRALPRPSGQWTGPAVVRVSGDRRSRGAGVLPATRMRTHMGSCDSLRHPPAPPASYTSFLPLRPLLTHSTPPPLTTTTTATTARCVVHSGTHHEIVLAGVVSLCRWPTDAN